MKRSRLSILDDLLYLVIFLVATGLVFFAVSDTNDVYPLLTSAAVVSTPNDRDDVARDQASRVRPSRPADVLVIAEK